MTWRTVDARGLACPEPVVLTSKALLETDRVITIVDNQVAIENVTRLARSKGFEVEIVHKSDGTYLSLSKKGADRTVAQPSSSVPIAPAPPGSGPIVLLVASDSLGRGPAELGERLMGAFFHTLLETSPKPQTIILINTGVKLAVSGSRALEDLQLLSEQGVDIWACGTCLGYFELTAKLAVGRVSNMYDIATAIFQAGKLVEL
jgi:selenium metabolism protein YedF